MQLCVGDFVNGGFERLNVYNLILNNPKLDVNKVFDMVDRDIKKNAKDFDVLSLKYFIALVKDGIQ